ncbi:hypothetical protein FGIG_01501 [Fasciola gigantica]|uniref:Uncharacterized protein n=1 Tax=Fasciola gigantica TaxID=46835 RepID=A0A504YB13_FASGI|nr:hypothetical protein FGIG_01501 [Fasciola gigantica]
MSFQRYSLTNYPPVLATNQQISKPYLEHHRSPASQRIPPLRRPLGKRKTCSHCPTAPQLFTIEHHNPIHALKSEQLNQYCRERRTPDWDFEQPLNNDYRMQIISPCLDRISLKNSTGRFFDGAKLNHPEETVTPRETKHLPGLFPEDAQGLITMSSLRRSFSESFESKLPFNRLPPMKGQDYFL